MMLHSRFAVPNGAGWDLDVRHYFDPTRRDPRLPPVVMIPGYCMNSFILDYHPAGESLIGHLAAQGFEVWAGNLRGQGDSKRRRGRRSYGFADLALVDVPEVLRFVGRHNHSERDGVALVGCSLGATIAYTYLAHFHDDHGVELLVNFGGPLRWNRVHPLVYLLSRRPSLIGMVPVRGTRHLMRQAVPWAQRFPWLVSFYLNPDIVDLSHADELVKTIDDPSRRLNFEIARWIKNKELVVQGLNVCHSLYSITAPLLCIVAGQDGIVTPEAALSILDSIGSADTEVIEVGTDDIPHAHADLFLADGAHEHVYQPLARWLRSRSL